MPTVTKILTFNAGLNRSSLATIGYVLTPAGGSDGARTTTGVAENPSGSGIYRVTLTLDAGTSYEILWDTGSGDPSGTPYYASETIDPELASTPSAPVSSSTATATAGLTPYYCTDEDIAVRIPGDYVALCPPWQVLASGIDGTLSAASPWDLGSASTAFDTAGVGVGNVVHLTKPFKGTGQLFGVTSAAGSVLSLKRLGPAGSGQPPVTADTTGITFSVLTYAPQIEDAGYDLRLRFGLDEKTVLRNSDQIYDQRVLRQLCILTVVARQLATNVRDDRGDWALKLKQAQKDLDDLIDRTSVRWGPFGNSQPPVGRFSTRLAR